MDQIIKISGVISSLLISIYLIYKIFERLKDKQQGFGAKSLRMISIAIFLPIFVILAITTDINREALVGLIGTIAGYILSDSSEEKDS